MKFRFTEDQWLKMGSLADSGTIEISQMLLERASSLAIDIASCGDGTYVALAQAIATASAVITEPINWIEWTFETSQTPNIGSEVLVQYQKLDSTEQEVTLAEFDPMDGDGPWWVDGGLMDFGNVLFWAHKPIGPRD